MPIAASHPKSSSVFFAFSIFLLLMGECFATSPAFGDEKLNATQLVQMAKSNSPQLQQSITVTFDEKSLKEGNAWVGHGPDFFFATHATSEPLLYIDDVPGPKMQKLSGDLWFAAARIEAVGKLHSFYYMLEGKKFGGTFDLPAFGPDSYQQPGVPSGTLSDKIIHTSKIYDGMKSEYWIYVPAQYDRQNSCGLDGFSGWRMVR